MDNIYIIASLNDGGIRRILATASTKEDLAGIADKIVTHYVKKGYALADVWEALAGYDVGPLYKAYYLKRSKTRKLAADLIIFELYEQPIEAPASFDPSTLDL